MFLEGFFRILEKKIFFRSKKHRVFFFFFDILSFARQRHWSRASSASARESGWISETRARRQKVIVAGSIILFSTCKSETRRERAVHLHSVHSIRGGKKKSRAHVHFLEKNKTFLGDEEIPPSLTSNLCVVSWGESFRANTSPKQSG